MRSRIGSTFKAKLTKIAVIRTFTASSAVGAYVGAIGTKPAILTHIRTVFTGFTAISTNHGAFFAKTAGKAESCTFVTALTAVGTYLNTVFTQTTSTAELRAIFTGAASGADLGTLGAMLLTFWADFGTAGAGSAGTADRIAG